MKLPKNTTHPTNCYALPWGWNQGGLSAKCCKGQKEAWGSKSTSHRSFRSLIYPCWTDSTHGEAALASGGNSNDAMKFRCILGKSPFKIYAEQKLPGHKKGSEIQRVHHKLWI